MLQGCAAIGLTLLAVGAGTAAGQGVSYTLGSIADKTFTASLDGVDAATLTTLHRMDIEVAKDEPRKDGGREITATAGDRAVEIELDKLTDRTSRMRVVVAHGWFFNDRAPVTRSSCRSARRSTTSRRSLGSFEPRSRPGAPPPGRCREEPNELRLKSD